VSYRRAVRRGLATICALAALAGCGGGLTRAEYVAAADEI
jgi:hypothetical protein